METKQNDTIDIRAFFRTLWSRRRVFYIVLPVTMVVSSALILCVPRYYETTVSLVPETQSPGNTGALGALASSFGFDISNMVSEDAVKPQIYPQVIKSHDFLVNLFPLQIRTSDGQYSGPYFEYLMTKTKFPFWTVAKVRIKNFIFSSKEAPRLADMQAGGDKGMNMFWMTKRELSGVMCMQNNIQCKFDKKTDVLSITVTDQDKLVSAMIADSVCDALRCFMTDYRTQKAKVDMIYYKEMMEEAQNEYNRASLDYINYVDSHSNLSLEKYRTEAHNLEMEMQIKSSVYMSFQKQYITSQAKVQEQTPVFKIIESATVPLKAAGPKRGLFVIFMTFFAAAVTAIILGAKELKLWF